MALILSKDSLLYSLPSTLSIMLSIFIFFPQKMFCNSIWVIWNFINAILNTIVQCWGGNKRVKCAKLRECDLVGIKTRYAHHSSIRIYYSLSAHVQDAVHSLAFLLTAPAQLEATTSCFFQPVPISQLHIIFWLDDCQPRLWAYGVNSMIH